MEKIVWEIDNRDNETTRLIVKAKDGIERETIVLDRDDVMELMASFIENDRVTQQKTIQSLYDQFIDRCILGQGYDVDCGKIVKRD